jgi:hypothetical protein
MKWFVHGWLVVGWLLASAQAQINPADLTTVRSRSGQFVVYANQSPTGTPAATRLAGSTNLVALEPTTLVVSCERVKQALLAELAAPDQWRGKIHLLLHAFQSPDETIIVTASKFADSWRYQMELPDAIEPPRFVRAMVRLLLVEWANRNGTAGSAEIPLWLSEGLAQQILAASDVDLVVAAPGVDASGLSLNRTLRDTRKSNPLAPNRNRPRAESLLTVEQLSWTSEELLVGDTAEIFRSSAQLFVSELQRLQDGRACLRAMVDALPRCLNWQTAFFQAFSAHFQEPLDLERWWALQIVHFAGRNPAPAQSEEESWSKLAELVRVPLQVRSGSNDLPERAEATLQTIIQEWDYASQRQALQARVRSLQLMSPGLAQPLRGLADAYLQTLEAYLRKIGKTGLSLTARPLAPAVRRAIEGTVNQLGELDARLEALRAGSQTNAVQSSSEVPGSP